MQTWEGEVSPEPWKTPWNQRGRDTDREEETQTGRKDRKGRR